MFVSFKKMCTKEDKINTDYRQKAPYRYLALSQYTDETVSNSFTLSLVQANKSPVLPFVISAVFSVTKPLIIEAYHMPSVLKWSCAFSGLLVWTEVVFKTLVCMADCFHIKGPF